MSKPLSDNTPPSLVDRISAHLRADILRGRYQAGDRLPSERELAERFDTHRGTVREALKKLEQLGLAEIKKGGARAAPIEEASLDVVRHLMELDATPDPDVFDQVFEVFGSLFALSARLFAERANEAERARAREIFDQLLAERSSMADEFAQVQQLSELFAESSRNLVLKLVRRGLFIEVISRIDRPETLLRPPETERDGLLRDLAAAIDTKDGSAASDAIFSLTQAVRANAVALLEAQRREDAEQHGNAAALTPDPTHAVHGALRR